jgi:hypothetical protein
MSDKKKHQQQNSETNNKIQAAVGTAPRAPNTKAGDGNGDDEQKPPKKVSNPDWWMVWLTGFLGVITFATFWVLWYQLSDTKESFTKDQRPYIWITNGTNERPNVYREAGYPDRIAITVHYTNFGKSPAVKIHSAYQIQTGVGANARFKPMPLGTSETILPTGKDDFFIATSDPLSADEIIKAFAIGGGVMIAARWQFLDLSGHLYESDICIANEAAPRASWGYCESANKIKDCAVDDCSVWP